MTETQTPCPQCGDTGFVPPFMDDCTACTIAVMGALAPVGWEAPTVDATNTIAGGFIEAPHSPFPPHPVKGAMAFLGGNHFVFDGDAWQPLPTETLTVAEYGEKYGVVHASEVVEATIAAAHVADVEAEIRTADEELDAMFEADDATPAAPPFKPITDAPDYAAGYGEAGIYSDPSISYGSTKTAKLMTEAQEKLMRKLVAERDPANSAVALAQTRLDSPTANISAKGASKMIDDLMKVPADPAKKAPRPNSYDGTCGICKGPVAAGTGRIEKSAAGRWVTYHLDGLCLSAEASAALFADRVVEPGLYKHTVVDPVKTAIYRVKKSRSSDRLYGELVIPVVDGTVSFSYNAKAMGFLRKSDKLTWQEARDFGCAYGSCVACGRTLSDPRSLVQGYGPQCGSRYSWPLINAKQAEAVIAGTLTWEEAIGIVV